MSINKLWSKRLPLSLIGLWLLVFAIIPFGLITVISFLQHDTDHMVIWHFDLHSYEQLFSNIFFRITWHSFILAACCTLITLLIGYPVAAILARSSEKVKSLLLLFLILPFWTSSLIRTYALLALIKTKGLLNTLLLHLGLIHHPLNILYSNSAVMIALVYNLLPFMILPLYSHIEKLDQRIFDAARDLGASKMRIFFSITLPLTRPGIIAGTLFVMLPSMTLFYIPDLLGGAKSLLLGNLIENQFLLMNDWPGGCATSVLLTVFMLFLVWLYRRSNRSAHLPEAL